LIGFVFSLLKSGLILIIPFDTIIYLHSAMTQIGFVFSKSSQNSAYSCANCAQTDTYATDYRPCFLGCLPAANWRHAVLVSTVFCLMGIGIISKRLLVHIFAGRGFLGADRALSPQVVASAYYSHFIRNYMYITWLFACCGLGLHSHSAGSAPAYLVTNSSGSNMIDFLYYTVVTMSTLGYGDINPASKGAKLVAVLQVFVGVFILLTYAGAIISHHLSRLEAEDKKHMTSTGGN
jgi:hypothetical protein